MLVSLFMAMGLTTRLLCADADGYSSFWPANAAMLVALLRFPASRAACMLVLCFAGNLLLNRITGHTVGEGILTCFANLLQVLVAAGPVRRFCGARTDLTRLRRQGRFGLIVFVATAIEAGLGVFVEAHFLSDNGNVVGDWVQWVLCDSLGLMLATPAVLLLMDWLPDRRFTSEPSFEPLVLMLGILLLTVVGFQSPRSFLFFFLYPAMVTLAFRARPAWALSTVLFVSILVSSFTAHDLGPIAHMSPDGPLMSENLLQPYLWTLFLSTLPANMVVGEKLRHARRLGQMHAHMEHAATHDPLTGLVTRQVFRNDLAARLRSGAGGMLLFIDLDHFKQVNDTLGHPAGDTVLRLFSERMLTCVKPFGGETARFGGDEFAMLLPTMSSATRLREVIAMMLDAARLPYHLKNGTARLSISVGGAALDSAAGHADEVIRRADEALYATKAAGRNGYRLHGDPIPPVLAAWSLDPPGTMAS